MMTCRSKGKDWEALLASAFESIPNCTIRKQDPPIAYMRNLRGASFEARYIARGGLDFEGGHGSFFIGIEAKDIFDNRFNFKSKLKQHQLERMKELDSAGASALLAVRFKSEAGDNACFITYPLLKLWMDEGKKSFTVKDALDAVLRNDVPVEPYIYPVTTKSQLRSDMTVILEDCTWKDDQWGADT